MVKLSEIPNLMLPEKSNYDSSCQHPLEYNMAIKKQGSKCLRMNREKLSEICTKAFIDYWNTYKSNPSGEIFADAINENLKDLLECGEGEA